MTISDHLSRHRSSLDPVTRADDLVAAARSLPDPVQQRPDTPGQWLEAVERATGEQRIIEQQRSRQLDHDLCVSL